MLSVFPRDVLGEIFDLIESVSENFPTYLLAHLSHRLMVSYCHQPMSGVRRPSSVVRRASSVVRRPSSTIASNDIFSETAKPRALIFGM